MSHTKLAVAVKVLASFESCGLHTSSALGTAPCVDWNGVRLEALPDSAPTMAKVDLHGFIAACRVLGGRVELHRDGDSL